MLVAARARIAPFILRFGVRANAQFGSHRIGNDRRRVGELQRKEAQARQMEKSEPEDQAHGSTPQSVLPRKSI